MENVNWKALSLLAVTLLVALALQAGAIKIMINLSRQPDGPAVVASGGRAAPGKAALANPAPHQSAAPEERAVSEPAPPAKEPKSAVALVADPPHLAEPSAQPVQHAAAPHGEPGADVRQAPVPVGGAPTGPSAEAALAAAEAKPQPVATAQPARPPAPAVPAPAAPAAPSAQAGAAPEPVAGGELQEQSWLKTRNPKNYTVQLYSGKDIGTLKEIAAATASTEPQAYYSTGSRSGSWYSLVAGDYPDAAAAQAAAAKLSDRSPALKPWVRRFEEIQARMR
jgi:septal ring-binding cell division protein DamX